MFLAASPNSTASSLEVDTTGLRAGWFAMRNDADCAGAMAEVEIVLHELALLTRRSSPERSSRVNDAPKAPSVVPASSPIDRLVLDAGLDFVVHDDGMIELTEAGFGRMRQAHSVGLDTVIKIDGREVFCFPVTQLGGASSDR
jgi:hypothetical protein